MLQKYAIKRAGLFGSYVRGDDQGQSDIDILVEVASNVSLLDFVGIKMELEDVLGLKMDLVEYASLKPSLRERILAQEIHIL